LAGQQCRGWAELRMRWRDALVVGRGTRFICDGDWASKRKNRIPGYMTQGAMTRHIRVRWNDYTSIMASRRQGL
jgi:hypothetical protein